MERCLGESYAEAQGRLLKVFLNESREIVDRIRDHTSFNHINHFTPVQVERLLNHIDACHKILFELSEINDYEMPYRVPKLIYAARELRRIVS